MSELHKSNFHLYLIPGIHYLVEIFGFKLPSYLVF